MSGKTENLVKTCKALIISGFNCFQDWNSDFESEIKAMPGCNAPTDPGAIYVVDQNPQTYLDVFHLWQRGYLYYHFTDNTCEPGRSCNEFKTVILYSYFCANLHLYK